jgi:hypothetical protein
VNEVVRRDTERTGAAPDSCTVRVGSAPTASWSSPLKPILILQPFAARFQ